MIVAPAIDLRQGRCVQLVGGDPGAEAVSIPDPVAVAERWREMGFGTLHVVDLDAALGEVAHNRSLIGSLLALSGLAFQVGGGVRRKREAAELLEAGAERVIVGTRAVRERSWLESLVGAYPGRIMVAVDARDGRILTHGWQREDGRELVPFLEDLQGLSLAGVLFTDVGREGGMGGVARSSILDALTAAPVPLWGSGGIASFADLEFLEASGAKGAVLGMSIYTERLDGNELARRWGGGTPGEGCGESRSAYRRETP